MQRLRVDTRRGFARLSKLRFDKGVSGYLELLVAENELFAAELASVNLQASSYAQIVNGYQAMGGSWVDTAAGMAPKAQRSLGRVQSQAFNAGFGNLSSPS